jgi:autotransporter-associated beta strand protein
VLATIPAPVENISFAPAGIIKTGSGRMRLGSNNTYRGYSQVNGGTLQVDGIQPSSPVLVNAGATLMGGGTVGPLTMAGGTSIIRPGDHPGILTCSNFNRGGTGSGLLQIELDGPSFGQYDQLNVNGTVSLSGITLSPSLNYASSVGDQFTIINNDGTDPVSGTFTGLPQGKKLYIGQQLFQISYTGSSGNDVVLSRLITPPPPTLTIQRASPTSVLLFWPTNDPAFSLQTTTTLPATNWITALPLPVVIGTNNFVTNPVSNLEQFYRLSNP